MNLVLRPGPGLDLLHEVRLGLSSNLPESSCFKPIYDAPQAQYLRADLLVTSHWCFGWLVGFGVQRLFPVIQRVEQRYQPFSARHRGY